jgi:hypothetical protein
VRCLNDKGREDCRSCWGVPVPTTTTTTTLPSGLKCRACESKMCLPCRECTETKEGKTCSRCWSCHDFDFLKSSFNVSASQKSHKCDALNDKHKYDDDEVRCLSDEVQDCRVCWSMLAVAV